ncbi:MAG: hypothetical protein KF708_22590 [Pirellulales bacterium]|nr:hypothetical protein [Pirellulales bacterium]
MANIHMNGRERWQQLIHLVRILISDLLVTFGFWCSVVVVICLPLALVDQDGEPQLYMELAGITTTGLLLFVVGRAIRPR